MADSILFAAQGNDYLLNDDGLALLHPELAKAMQGGNDVDSYYIEKAKYLHSYNRSPADEDKNSKTFIQLTAADVEEQLANTPQIVFEVTDACNLNCTYCGYGELYGNYDTRESTQLPIEKATRFIDHLAQKWQSIQNKSALQDVYISFYGGEPLLNMPFIKSIVNHVKSLNCPTRTFTFSMTTNAVLLKRYMEYLVENEFKILISLDGNEENMGYRLDHAGQSAFKLISDNIDTLQQQYPEYFVKNINFSAVLHNKNSVESVYRYITDRYGKIPSISEVNSLGIKPEKQEQFMKTYRNATQSLYEAENYTEVEKGLFVEAGSYRSATAFLNQHSGFAFKDYSTLMYATKSSQVRQTGTCLPFSKKVFITVSGKILPCERIGQEYGLGEITDTNIELDINRVAELYNLSYSKLANQCRQCANLTSCKQCLFYLPTLKEKNVVCNGYLNKKGLAKYATHQIDFLSKHRDDYSRIMEEVNIG